VCQAEFVLAGVCGVHLTPITGQMTGRVSRKRFARCLQGCEGSGRRHNLTGIEPIHLAPTEAKCFSYRSRTTAFSGFAIKASRSFHVIAAKRRPFPPIWLKIILVNLPSAVRRAALARTRVATLATVFGRLTVAFTFVAFFLVFFIRVPSLGMPITIRVFREK